MKIKTDFLTEEIKRCRDIINNSNDSFDVWYAKVQIEIAYKLLKKYSAG